jgi:hypothetical protein
MTRLPRLTIAGLIAVAAVCAITGCTYSTSGNEIASSEADDAAATLAHSAQIAAPGPRDADFLLASSVDSTHFAPLAITVEALNWSGNSGTANGAHFSDKITATVDAKSAVDFGGAYNDSGSATECYELTVSLKYTRPYSTSTGISCDGLNVNTLPTVGPQPVLSPDALTKLEAVLATTTPAGLAADVRRQFPQKYIVVDTTDYEGRLIAALSVPSNRDCILAARERDGSVGPIYFDQTNAQVGEQGCNTGLVTRPYVSGH